MTEDIIVQVDNEMPQQVDLGEKVKVNLAKRVVAFKVKKSAILYEDRNLQRAQDTSASRE